MWKIGSKIPLSLKNRIKKATVDDLLLIGKKIGSAYYMYYMSFTDITHEVQRYTRYIGTASETYYGDGVTAGDWIFESGGILQIDKNEDEGIITFTVPTNVPANGVTNKLSTASQIYNWATLQNITGVGNTTNNNVQFESSAWIGTDNFASETTGWRVAYNGHADFRSLFTNELIAETFIADIDLALLSGHIVSKSVTQLSRDFTVPATGNTGTLYVEALPGHPTAWCFAVGDWIRMQIIDRSGGGLVWTQVWATIDSQDDINGGGDTNTGEQSYTVTIEDDGSSSGSVVHGGAAAQDYGQSGDGYIEQEAGYGTYRPWLQVVTWTTDPSNSSNLTMQGRFGNLNGVTNASGYGFYSENAFLTGSILAGDLTKSGNYLEYASGVMTLVGTLTIQGGSGITNLSDSGGLATEDSADWQTEVSGTGKPSDNADVTADNPQAWNWVTDDGAKPEDNADVTADHSLDINHTGSSAPASPKEGWLWHDTSTNPDTLKRYNGTSWIVVATFEASWSGVVNDGGKPENNATDGADWTSNLDNIPSRFSTDSGNPPATGLYATSEYLGYWDSTNGWQAFISNTGDFGFEGDGDNYISWDGSALTVQGLIRTADSGKRMVLDNSDNTMKFYDINGNKVITLDDDIVSTYPGILIERGTDYSLSLLADRFLMESANDETDIWPGWISMQGDESVNFNTFDLNVNASIYGHDAIKIKFDGYTDDGNQEFMHGLPTDRIYANLDVGQVYIKDFDTNHPTLRIKPPSGFT